MKFLIVDKSPEVRLSIKKIICSGNQRHQVAEASDYDLAFFCLYSFSPDYVIMDLDSLNGKGMMMLQSSISLLPASRVFIFTEFSENIIKNKLIESGVEKVFAKSRDTDSFIEELIAVITDNEIEYELLCPGTKDNNEI